MQNSVYKTTYDCDIVKTSCDTHAVFFHLLTQSKNVLPEVRIENHVNSKNSDMVNENSIQYMKLTR